MSKIKKELIHTKSGDYYGYMGEKTGVYLESIELRVGDVVTRVIGDMIYTAVVVKNVNQEFYSFMGCFYDPLKNELERSSLVKILKSAEDVDINFINALHSNYFAIIEKKPKQMTLAEIEEALGYEVEIIGERS